MKNLTLKEAIDSIDSNIMKVHYIYKDNQNEYIVDDKIRIGKIVEIITPMKLKLNKTTIGTTDETITGEKTYTCVDMNRIPKSFKLFATTINVVWKNKELNDRTRYGETSYSESLIRLSDTHGLDKLSDDKILDTFYHEKVHSILDHMNERDLSDNEKFVDVFAKLLRQSDETEVFETGKKLK